MFNKLLGRKNVRNKIQRNFICESEKVVAPMNVAVSQFLQPPSSLLTKDENMSVFSLFPLGSQSLATAVVEIFVTSPPNHIKWNQLDVGVLCLVKDHLKSSVYFRVYCPERQILVWEHEIYNNMQYNAPCTFLHSFEGQECIVGFNFASEEEALQFRQMFFTTMEKERGIIDLTVKAKHSKEKKQNGRKRRITKENISEPSNFQHEAGYSLQDQYADKEKLLQQFLKEAGVITEKDMQDEKVVKILHKFVEENGGVNNILKNCSQSQPCQPPPEPHLPQPPANSTTPTSGGGLPPPAPALPSLMNDLPLPPIFNPDRVEPKPADNKDPRSELFNSICRGEFKLNKTGTKERNRPSLKLEPKEEAPQNMLDLLRQRINDRRTKLESDSDEQEDESGTEFSD